MQKLLADPASRLIVESTVQLAHGLGLHVVAEGVEDEETLTALVEVGCDLVQGFLLGRPVAPEILAARLREQGPPPVHVPAQAVPGGALRAVR